jgi:hypothetical protein
LGHIDTLFGHQQITKTSDNKPGAVKSKRAVPANSGPTLAFVYCKRGQIHVNYIKDFVSN